MNDAQQTIEQLQALEQHIQRLTIQKQNVQGQLIEVESALEELSGAEESWRIVGNIMVKTSPEKLKESLGSREEKLKARVQQFSQQEDRLRKKAQELQRHVMESMNDGPGRDDKRDS